jgi:4-nitrophenol 2-monooxygenase / 4-nitrocatechol 4-monooxygenase, reductase component
MTPTLTPDAFRQVIGSFASGVTVITARHNNALHGATASAVSSLSLEPPMLLVCLARQSSTARAMSAAGRFAVNVLGEDHAELAVRFATRGIDRFEGVDVAVGHHGEPLLVEAIATFECAVSEEVAGGTHTIFLARVEHGGRREGPPLAYFRGRFGRLEMESDEIAVREIRALVFDRALPLGEEIDIARLGEQLGVPRGVAFHALSKLALEGVVERTPRGEFVAPPLTLGTAEASLRARYAITLGVAALTVGRIPAERVRALRERLDAMEACQRGGGVLDAAAWVSARREFADEHVSMADSPALVDASRRVNVPGMIARLQGGEEAEDAAHAPASVYPLYEQIVAGYERGDLSLVLSAEHELLRLRLDSTRAMFADRVEI